MTSSNPELIILRGLPGSGKTTWARRYLRDHPAAVRVNRDDLRAMLHGDRPWGMADEATTIAVRNATIVAALKAQRTVVVDDTNLSALHRQELTALAERYGVCTRLVVLDTPIAECIRRDALRPRPVGAARIAELARCWEKEGAVT